MPQLQDDCRQGSNVKPLVIDICCGLGGWTKGFLAEGWDAIGFDIERHEYPGKLVLQDVRTLCGHLLRHAALIVASPPCQEFSRWDQPWTRAKNPPFPTLAIDLVRACWRIAAEAEVAIVLENVRGAQRFIGPARAHFGKQYLWGDVPALLPEWGPGQAAGRQKQSLSSTARAQRAEIPFELASYIARAFKPAAPLTGDTFSEHNDFDLQTPQHLVE